MNRGFQILAFLLISATSQAQKLNIENLINAIYKDQVAAEKIDTVVFLNICENKFFVGGSRSQHPIKSILFSSKEAFDNYLKSRKECLIFKASIIEIGRNTMRLQVGLYRCSYTDAFKESNFLIFVDERTISCTLSGRGWILSKTISVEDH